MADMSASLYNKLMEHLLHVGTTRVAAPNERLLLAEELRAEQGASARVRQERERQAQVKRINSISPLARNSDPDTSHEAAATVDVKGQVEALVDFMTKHDRPSGWTWDELSNWLAPHVSWRRLSDARGLGLIFWVVEGDDRKIVTRTARTGRAQRACRVVKS